MKILSAKQIQEADQYTIKNEPIDSIDLMERATLTFSKWFLNHFSRKHPIHIYCGLGNNGGDGLAIARQLHEFGYSSNIHLLKFDGQASPDFLVNYKRLAEKIPIHNYFDKADFIPINDNSIIIDALFGSGLNRPLESLAAQLVTFLNKQVAYSKIAVDIPSGLYADKPSVEPIFRADKTLSFQLPKLAFFASENHSCCGEWTITDIGLDKKFIAQQASNYESIRSEKIKQSLKKRTKFSHKGSYGHLLLAAGSKGKMGAALLAAQAALRSGLGLLTAHVPASAYQIMQSNLPECMLHLDEHEEILSELPDCTPYDALAIGPGIGKNQLTKQLIEQACQLDKAIVLDADALNLIAENQIPFPANAIITPHPKEFERLFGTTNNSFARWELQREMAKKHHIYIILKGAHSSIASPKGIIYFNSTGNTGMATGGSGDVLTGIIGSLLAQQYTPLEASLIAVYVHGLAADLALSEQSEESMLPTDYINWIGKTLKKLRASQ